jgi:hypothetical protein
MNKYKLEDKFWNDPEWQQQQVLKFKRLGFADEKISDFLLTAVHGGEKFLKDKNDPNKVYYIVPAEVLSGQWTEYPELDKVPKGAVYESLVGYDAKDVRVKELIKSKIQKAQVA